MYGRNYHRQQQPAGPDQEKDFSGFDCGKFEVTAHSCEDLCVYRKGQVGIIPEKCAPKKYVSLEIKTSSSTSLPT